MAIEDAELSIPPHSSTETFLDKANWLLLAMGYVGDSSSPLLLFFTVAHNKIKQVKGNLVKTKGK